MTKKIMICMPGSIAEPVPKEKKDCDTLSDLLKNVYPGEFFYQFTVVPSHRDRLITDFPAIIPTEATIRLPPRGLDECVEYVIGKFGKEKQAKQYLDSLPK